jgi:phosphohistidine phosphatase
VELYLMRHGEAAPGAPDAGRRLTPDGAAAVGRVAARAGVAGVRLDHVYHSGLVRAQQTAELLAGAVSTADRVGRREGLAPSDPVAPIARWLLDPAVLDGPQSIALVSHLPFLDLLAARLVAGRDDAQAIAFAPGLLVRLVPKRQQDGYCLVWALAPEIA